MRSLYAAMLAFFLAGLSLVTAATPSHSCSTLSTNFSIIANTSSTTTNYGALGAPCRGTRCGLFFSANASNIITSYSIGKQAQLIIAYSGQRTNPAGDFAYNYNFVDTPNVVYFGSLKKTEPKKRTPRLKCALQADTDGSCNLVCENVIARVQTVGYSVDTTNYNQWSLGTNSNMTGFVPVVIKAVPPPF